MFSSGRCLFRRTGIKVIDSIRRWRPLYSPIAYLQPDELQCVVIIVVYFWMGAGNCLVRVIASGASGSWTARLISHLTNTD